jgi:hypothetical protein
MTDWCARIGKSSRLAGYGLRGTVEGQVPTQAPLFQASSSPSISGDPSVIIIAREMVARILAPVTVSSPNSRYVDVRSRSRHAAYGLRRGAERSARKSMER